MKSWFSARFNFPVAKLLDYAEQVNALETHPNPFALVTAAICVPGKPATIQLPFTAPNSPWFDDPTAKAAGSGNGYSTSLAYWTG